MANEYKKELVGGVKTRVSGPCATIWPTEAGFVVSDDCTRSSQFFFLKNQEKEAVDKFLTLNK